MANPYDKILEKQGLSYSDLTPEEKELYHLAGRGTKAIGLSELKDHIDTISFALLLDHCETPDTPDFQDKNKYQKARLKNYALLKAFMESPDKVAKSIERATEEE